MNQQKDRMLSLYNDRRLTDITFVIDDEEIQGHKVILAACCNYFHTLFFGDTSDASATRITLNETPSKAFKEVIHFCYLSEVDIAGWNADEVSSLLSLAREYAYDCVVEEVWKEIRKQSLLNPASIATYYDSAVQQNFQNALNAIKLHLHRNYTSVLESKEFVKYSADLVAFIFVGEEVNRKVINAIWKWKAFHTEQEVQTLFILFYWEAVSPTLLAEIIRVMIPEANLLQVSEPAEVVTVEESDEDEFAWPDA